MAINFVSMSKIIKNALGGDGDLELHNDYETESLRVWYKNARGACSFTIPISIFECVSNPTRYILREIEARMPTSGTYGSLAAADYQQIAAMQQQMSIQQQTAQMQNMAAGMGILGANSLLRVGTVNNDINVIHEIVSPVNPACPRCNSKKFVSGFKVKDKQWYCQHCDCCFLDVVDKPDKVCEAKGKFEILPNAGKVVGLEVTGPIIADDFIKRKETKVDKDVLPDISLTRALKWAVVALIALALGERVWKAFGEKLVKNIEQTIAGKKEPVV